MTISEARRKRDEAKKLLLDNTDPGVKRKLDKITVLNETKNTFGLIAEEYIARMEARDAAPTTISKTRWLLQSLAAALTERPIREITAAEILNLLQKIEKSGRRETARRLRGVMSSVFRFAIVTLRADTDPTVVLQGALLPPRVEGRAAITDEEAFGKLLNAIEDYDGWPTLKAAIKFQILTCTRPGEPRGAGRAEFDLDKAVWRIPAERMKMRRQHDVPLSRQALQLLNDIWPYSNGGDLVFPSVRSERQQLSENAFNAALRRMGYGKEEVTAHGFRVTASSILNSRGYDADVIEAALAHQDRNAIRRTYNRATYWDQRVALMQDWADLLDGFRAMD